MTCINVSNPSDLPETETCSADTDTYDVFHCLICGSLQPKLQKFLSDSSQRLSNYFCKLYNVSSANDEVDIGVIFEDSIVCSPCNQELRDIETLYSQIERLKCEIQRIRQGYDSRLKILVDNVRGKEEEFQGNHSGAAYSEIDTWRKREKLYKYAFPNSESSPADVFHMLDLDLSSGQSSAFSTVVVQESKFIANPSPSQNIDEKCTFKFQENSNNGDVDYEEFGSDEGHEALYPFTAPTDEEDAVDEDPLNVEKSSCWYPSEISMTSHVGNPRKIGAAKTKRQIPEAPVDSTITIYALPEKNTLSHRNTGSDELISPLPLLALKSEVDVEENVEGSRSSELEDSDSDALRKKYNIRELSISVERLRAMPNIISNVQLLPLKPKRKYTRRGLGTSKKTMPNIVNVQLPLKPKREYTPRGLGAKKGKGRMRPFSCPYPDCCTTFWLELQIEGHIKRAHQGVPKPFSCEICDSTFRGYPELTDHQNIHKGLKPHNCSKCDKTFATKIQLRCHRKATHSTNDKPGAEVNPNSTRNYVRREYLSSSSALDKIRKFVCSHAGCTLSFELELQRDGHVKRAHEGVSKPFSCDTCDRSFPGYHELADHMNVHKGLTPYHCDRCENLTFATHAKLRYHMKRIHPAVPFRCGECGKILCNKIVFENHLRSHTKERPFVCDVCGRTFTQKDILRNHRLTHPELNLGVPECKFCGKVFAGGKYYLEMHERQHTGDFRFKCDLCNFGTSLKTVFTKHALSHSDKKNFECDTCKHKFKSVGAMNQHKRQYHPATKDFTCADCGKSFSCKKYLEVHEDIHKKVKRLLCNRCGKSFAQYPSYNYHMKNSHKNDSLV